MSYNMTSTKKNGDSSVFQSKKKQRRFSKDNKIIKWHKLVTNQTVNAYSISGSKDSLWIIDDDTKKVLKFNKTIGQFNVKGHVNASEISAGLNGRAVIQE